MGWIPGCGAGERGKGGTLLAQRPRRLAQISVSVRGITRHGACGSVLRRARGAPRSGPLTLSVVAEGGARADAPALLRLRLALSRAQGSPLSPPARTQRGARGHAPTRSPA